MSVGQRVGVEKVEAAAWTLVEHRVTPQVLITCIKSESST